jgi:hypothetical protein
MKNERKNLIIIIFIYVLLLLIDGIIRNQMISRILPESYQPISNVVNGFSLLFSTIWMVIIIVLSIIFTFLYTAIFNDTFDYNKLLKAWSNLVFVDIIIGIGKFSLLWILLDDEISYISVNENTIKNLSNLSYTIVCEKMDLITIYVSNFTFAISLYLSSKKDVVFSITMSLLLLGMMLSLYYKII